MIYVEGVKTQNYAKVILMVDNFIYWAKTELAFCGGFGLFVGFAIENVAISVVGGFFGAATALYVWNKGIMLDAKRKRFNEEHQQKLNELALAEKKALLIVVEADARLAELRVVNEEDKVMHAVANRMKSYDSHGNPLEGGEFIY